MIKAIIFDVNDTLDENFSIKFSSMETALKNAGFKGAKELAKEVIVNIDRVDLMHPDWRMDQIVEEAMVGVQADISKKQGIFNEYMSLRKEGKDINKDFLQILPMLAKKYSLIIFTAGRKESIWNWLKKHDIEKYFKKVYTTTDLGIQKPNLQAYETILLENTIKQDECAMVGDDLLKDLLPAKMLGIKTILVSGIVDAHIRNFSELEDSLSR